MRWTLTGKDDFSAVIRDGQTVIGVVGYHTEEEKANARKATAAPEAIALLERIATCPNCQRNHFELMADIRRILARAKPLN